MEKTMKRISMLAVLALVAMASLSCSNELTNNAAPVKLVLSNTQAISQVDLQAGATGCGVDIGTISMQVIPKNAGASTDLTAVRVNRYRVSYRRVDGGTMVPASFVRSTDTLIRVDETVGLSSFVVIEADALSQAPFAALLPQNGGRDPQTGRAFVKLEVIIEVFGETLGGDKVSDSTAFQIDFCFNCQGCH
jgi:hypothetical protein